jgi:hypothetical protein
MEAVLKMIYVPVDNNKHNVVVGRACPVCGEGCEVVAGMINCANGCTKGWLEV